MHDDKCIMAEKSSRLLCGGAHCYGYKIRIFFWKILTVFEIVCELILFGGGGYVMVVSAYVKFLFNVFEDENMNDLLFKVVVG